MSDLRDNVLSIVETIENPPHGCSECGDFDSYEAGDECRHCEEEVQPMSVYDYIHDALDIEYTIGSDGSYLGARVLVAFGGPNIWIDTRYRRVDGHWWRDQNNMAYTDEMGIDDACRELFDCL